ncbi:MAG: right-handed parallel beta-helix repeat-containing protein [Nitrososphaerota archaeon]
MKKIYFFLLFPIFLGATVWEVPERFPKIQQAIDWEELRDGDTISVWGPPTNLPPYIYYEAINFKGKNILLANRSFIQPGMIPDRSAVQICWKENLDIAGITFEKGENRNAQILGFTIKFFPFGIIIDSASPTIKDCNIEKILITGIESHKSNAAILDCSLRTIGSYGIVWDSVLYNEPFPPVIIKNNYLDGFLGDSSYTVWGICLMNLQYPFPEERIVVDSNIIINFWAGGIHITKSNCFFTNNKIIDNQNWGIVCWQTHIDNKDPIIKRNFFINNRYDVGAKYFSLPNLGDETDPGYNQFGLRDSIWIHNLQETFAESIKAEYNWFGTDRPDTFPEKFLGPIDYIPWLHGPPEGDIKRSNLSIFSSFKKDYLPTNFFIYNSLGRLIYHKLEKDFIRSYSLKRFPSGVYFLKNKKKEGMIKIIFIK